MKYPRWPNRTRSLSNLRIATSLIVMSAAAVLAVQSGAPEKNVHAITADSPQSMKDAVHVMVELSDVPAAVLHAEALKEAREQADAARTYALAHPDAPGGARTDS